MRKLRRYATTFRRRYCPMTGPLQLHGFYVDTEKKTMHFDVVISFDIDYKEAIGIMMKEVQELYPDYSVQIVPDADIAD